MRFLFTLHKHRWHHFHPCIPCHQVITVFDTCCRQVKMLIKFDNHRGKTGCRGIYLPRIAFVGFHIHMDNRFRSATAGRCSHLEQTFNHQVRLHLCFEVLCLVQSSTGKPVQVSNLHFERFLHFFSGRRYKLQRPHSSPADVCQAVK